MSEPTSVFPPSYEKLTILRNVVHRFSDSKDLVLPERPIDSATDTKRYVDEAICILSESLSYSYENQILLVNVVNRVDNKIDYQFKYIQKQFAASSKTIKNFKSEINTELDHFRSEFRRFENEFEDVKNQLQDVKKDVRDLKKDVWDIKKELQYIRAEIGNVNALARNGLTNRLFHPIAEVRIFIPGDNGVMQHSVTPDFPPTVQHFWFLKSNSKYR